MELAFVVSAIRRYWWVIVITTFLGLLPGLMNRSSGPPVYESRAVLLVVPPTAATGGGSYNDPDRYVAGQLSVLRSQVLAEGVADELGDDYTADGVAGVMSFQLEPSTDVVTVVARTPSPETAETIGNAYVDAYLETLRAQVSQTQEGEMQALEEQIEFVRAQRDEANGQIDDALKPYRGREQVPDIEQIATALVSDRDDLQKQLDGLVETRAELENARLNVATQIVQRATEPKVPVPDPPNTLAVLGLVGGLFAGVVGAVVLARLSPTVLGDLQAEEILDRPVVGTMPKVPALARSRRTMLDRLPDDARELIDALCVRAEATEHELTLTVVVSGPQRVSGATTVAAAMARRFADNGATVLLVDANRNNQEIARLFPTGSGPTDAGSLRVVDLDGLLVTGAGGIVPVDDVVEAAAREAEVVIFDGGPLMETGAALRLARRADSVVLTMPARQRVSTLDTVAAELHGRAVLPVWTPARSSRRITPPRLTRRDHPPRDPAPPAAPSQPIEAHETV